MYRQDEYIEKLRENKLAFIKSINNILNFKKTDDKRDYEVDYNKVIIKTDKFKIYANFALDKSDIEIYKNLSYQDFIFITGIINAITIYCDNIITIKKEKGV